MPNRILFVTFGDEATASTRLRILNYIPYWDSISLRVDLQSDRKFSGISKVDKPIYAIELLLSAMKYDVVYIQKVLMPGKFVSILSEMTSVIYDFDDALYTSPPWKEGSSSSQQKMLNHMLESVSKVITGSPVLTEYARQYSDEVYTVPTTLPHEKYQVYQNNTCQNCEGRVTLGWIGHPDNLWYLEQYEDVIRRVLDIHSGSELMIVTSERNRTPFADRIGEDVRYEEWSQDTELDLVSQFDIAIRPLTDDAWTRGKGGFTSVVQCMAMACPVIATPVGLLSEIVDHGLMGYLAEDRNDWMEYLGLLIKSPQMREEYGKNAFSAVGDQNFWTHQRATEVLNIFT